MSIGLNFPFSLSTGSLGYFEVTEDVLAAIAANVKALCSTNWGERPMHQQLGMNFREFLFEPMTPALRPRIADRIVSQLRMWMPFLVLDQLLVLFTGDDGTIPPEGFQIKMRLLFGNRVVVVTQTVTP